MYQLAVTLMLANNLKRMKTIVSVRNARASERNARKEKTYAYISQERTRELTLGLIVHPDITPCSPPVTVVIIEMQA